MGWDVAARAKRKMVAALMGSLAPRKRCLRSLIWQEPIVARMACQEKAPPNEKTWPDVRQVCQFQFEAVDAEVLLSRRGP